MTVHRSSHVGVSGQGRSAVNAAAEGSPTALDLWIAGKFVRVFGAGGLGLVLWDGRDVGPRGDQVARVVAHDRGALWGMALRPGVRVGDLYSQGRITVDGDLVAALEHAFRALAGYDRRQSLLRLLQRAFLSSSPSLGRSRKNIHHHYDLGNAFYALWLDREAMQYTCAYYPTPGIALEEAQRAKMDHVCRKLWLQPDERVVEAGCGWGGLALHMARHYGARVRAFNISSEQIAWARERAAREGLDDRVEFVEDDWRSIRGTYDVFVSVGMLEHVGRGRYRELGRLIDRCLEPDGRGLIHSIGRDRRAPLNPWIRKRIFPGAYPPTLREMTDIVEPSCLSVLDVENLRLHYAETLRAWLSRFEDNADRVRGMFDDSFVRAWRLYLAGSIAAFTTGSLQLFQVLFARSGRNTLPWNRAYVYDRTSLAGKSS